MGDQFHISANEHADRLADQGAAKLSVELNAPTKHVGAIKQLGHGAEDASIKPLHEVMVYFASGSKAWKSGEMGSLWAYDDSFIKLGSTVTSFPRAIKDVVILAE